MREREAERASDHYLPVIVLYSHTTVYVTILNVSLQTLSRCAALQ